VIGSSATPATDGDDRLAEGDDDDQSVPLGEVRGVTRRLQNAGDALRSALESLPAAEAAALIRTLTKVAAHVERAVREAEGDAKP